MATSLPGCLLHQCYLALSKTHKTPTVHSWMHPIPMTAGSPCLLPKILGFMCSCFFSQKQTVKRESAHGEMRISYKSLWSFHIWGNNPLGSPKPQRNQWKVSQEDWASSEKFPPHHGYSQVYSYSPLIEQGMFPLLQGGTELTGKVWIWSRPEITTGTKYDPQKHTAMKLCQICIFIYLIS